MQEGHVDAEGSPEPGADLGTIMLSTPNTGSTMPSSPWCDAVMAMRVKRTFSRPTAAAMPVVSYTSLHTT